MDNRYGLTERECEVIRLIAQHLGNKQIAKALCISVHTVKNHVHSILEKTSKNSRFDAARLFLGVEVNQPGGLLDQLCRKCPVAAKADVVAADLNRLANELTGGRAHGRTEANSVDHTSHLRVFGDLV